ncbi:hypothetical protein P167DRAFT_286991 [Morchella conica CCBAS932]|uniref:Uncharacterized protein n=1 Tax=Morchella conica CCBAS932 TaxID=1392247 RepID=A0A3N4KGY0_9PEZI|nr:hypothetical protein P167DRAFT_286991 [Morchella conica CCBAS932]
MRRTYTLLAPLIFVCYISYVDSPFLFGFPPPPPVVWCDALPVLWVLFSFVFLYLSFFLFSYLHTSLNCRRNREFFFVSSAAFIFLSEHLLSSEPARPLLNSCFL